MINIQILAFLYVDSKVLWPIVLILAAIFGFSVARLLMSSYTILKKDTKNDEVAKQKAIAAIIRLIIVTLGIVYLFVF